ncbi:MAG: uroporphyrinogen decarboxylase family protein [Armatimonadota bacterium]|nr:uroporphyrinogen decarboxylase family protein [Armatimonadota bacterium]
MTNRERFRRLMNFEPVDRLPIFEWAPWWDKTIERWYNEGLPRDLKDGFAIRSYFGQDAHRQYWISPRKSSCPRPAGHGLGIIANRDDYLAIKEHLYPDPPFDKTTVKAWTEEQVRGETIIWISIDGFFWFPRTLLGIERHLFAFYDQPDLIKEINEDLLEFHLRTLEQFFEICIPDFMTFAEDMSYNHGPMLSKAQFDEFLAPYYSRITPRLHEKGVIPFVDTDGDVTKPVSWYEEVGIVGFLPLERMAGVDVNALRRDHPNLRMIGAFDKTVMHLGESRIRQEFERLMPVMRQGGFIPSVDHQTPPEVSLEDYRLWMCLLREYCEKAAQ